MARTTVDIDNSVLKDVKRLQQREGGSLGATISGLLAEALRQRKVGRPAEPVFHWISRPMHARIDLEDKEAVWGVLDGERGRGEPDA